LRKNRIAKYIREMSSAMAKVVIVSDMLNQRTTLSIKGESLTWQWREDGLVCPGASIALQIHPLAAEAIMLEEIEEFLGMEGVGEDEVAYINESGGKLDGAYLHPLCLGEPTYKLILAKEVLKNLYSRFQERGRKINEDLIGESISYGALEPFLSLVNM